MTNKGLYGQARGDERRDGNAVFADRIFSENHVAEGTEVTHLRKLVAAQRWEEVTTFTDSLRQQGHGLTRVQSMLTRAMAGLSL